MFRKSNAVADEALEVDELGVLEEQVPRVVREWPAAPFPNTQCGLDGCTNDPGAEALEVLEDVFVREVLILPKCHDEVVRILRKHDGLEVWYSPWRIGH